MRKRDSSICLVLVVLTWIVFFQVRNFDFVNFDDGAYIFENEQMQKGLSWDSLRWSFSGAGAETTGSWHPLTWLSLMADAELFKDYAGGFHLTSVLFHTANVLLLYALLMQMTGDRPKSMFVAALFAVHPLHVESVAWVSERKDVLSTFFGLISLCAYVCYAQLSGMKWYLIALAAFVLSLLSKQMLVTLPFLLLLLDFWPLQRVRWSRLIVWEKVPFILLTVPFCVVAVAGQGKAIVPLEQFSIPERLSNALVVSVIYVFKTVAPYNLACFYPHPQSIPLWQTAGATLLLVLVSIGAVAGWRKRPYLLVGWLWYLGSLAPVIGLVQIGSQRMADRYTYIPSIGLFVAVTWLVPALIPAGLLRRRILVCLAVVTLVVFTGMAWVQTGYWKNSTTLYEHAAAVTEHNDLAHYNLADIYYEVDEFEEAILHFRKALEINPNDPEARNALGLALTEVKRFEDALVHFQASLKINPAQAQVQINLGLALQNLRMFEQATAHFQQAIKIDPDNASAHFNLGNVLGDQNRFDEAIQQFQTALRIDPQNARVHNNLGLALFMKERFAEASEYFEKALRIDPNDAFAHYNLARLLFQQGDREPALKHFREAIRFKPDFKEARESLQRALEE
jgi:Flp pilus assembly protein TadD